MLDAARIRALAQEHGTPLYLLDIDQVLERAARLAAFDTLRYAQKAHPGLALLRALASRGYAVDATSGFEIERALAAGFSPERIEPATDVLDRRTTMTEIDDLCLSKACHLLPDAQTLASLSSLCLRHRTQCQTCRRCAYAQ